MAEMSCVYAGTVRSAAGGSGGIFRQTAGDQRWEALTNGLLDETQVHAIRSCAAAGFWMAISRGSCPTASHLYAFCSFPRMTATFSTLGTASGSAGPVLPKMIERLRG